MMVDAGVPEATQAAGSRGRIEVVCLKPTHASEDHLTLKLYQPGQVYSLPGWLAETFIREGWGEPYSPRSVAAPSEYKVIEPVAFKRGRQARRR